MGLRVNRNECAKAIVKVCESFGATVTFDTSGKHPVAVLSWRGKTLRQVFPGSASDKRSALNSAAFTRRTLRGWSEE